LSLLILWSAQLRAEPAPKSGETAAMTEKARELYTEGTKAMDSGRYGEAHAALLAAWSLKQHAQIAANLGAAEVQLGRYRDAAAHLTFYLREAPKEKVKERLSAQELLARARKHVGALSIKVEPAGAEVLVDGEIVGKAPLAEEVFVDPGARVIEARQEGYATRKQAVSVAAGASQSVTLTLEQAPPAGAGAAAAEAGAAEAGAPAAAGAPTKPAWKGIAGGEGREKPTSGVRPLVIGGIVATGAAMSLGVAFAIVSSVHAADAEEQREAIVEKGSPTCLSPAKGAACEAIEDSIGARDRFGNLSVFSFVAGGLLGAGTVVYALTAPRPLGKAPVRAAPVVTPDGARLVVVGRF
jgi:hypothetical protein